jgi:hypothetical protein
MVIRIVDKLLFAALFLLALQIPILSDHYLQYLSGYYDATLAETKATTELANTHGYASVSDMIDELKENASHVVRDDALRKEATFVTLLRLEEGVRTLKYGHYFEKVYYLLTPAQFDTLSRVVDNFKPSIPLSPSAVIFSLLLALIVNMLLWTPHFCYCRLRKKAPHPYAYR